jgi:hypothetical protein
VVRRTLWWAARLAASADLEVAQRSLADFDAQPAHAGMTTFDGITFGPR